MLKGQQNENAQNEYRGLFPLGYPTINLENIRRRTGIEPDIDSMMGEVLEGLRKLVSCGEVGEIYDKQCPIVIRDGEFEKLMKFVGGIKPDFSTMNDEIQKGYASCFKMGRIERAKKLEKLTGVKPDNRTIQSVYKYLFSQEADVRNIANDSLGMAGHPERDECLEQRVIAFRCEFKRYAQDMERYTKIGPED